MISLNPIENLCTPRQLLNVTSAVPFSEIETIYRGYQVLLLILKPFRCSPELGLLTRSTEKARRLQASTDIPLQ